MQTEPINAVIFVNDEIKNSTDVNQIFTLPHEMKLDADYAKIKLFNTISDCNPNQEYECNYYMAQRCNAYSTVSIYYATNALDLYRNSIYRFVEKYFPKFYHTAMENFNIPQHVIELIDKITIPDILANEDGKFNILSDVVSGDPSSPSFKLAFLRYEQASDAVINLFTLNYINFIDNMIKSLCLLSTSLLEDEYKYIYEIVYSTQPESIPDIPTIINFLTAILREVAESELYFIRDGLSMISSNTTFMLAKQSATIPIGLGATSGKPLLTEQMFIDTITDVELKEKED